MCVSSADKSRHCSTLIALFQPSACPCWWPAVPGISQINAPLKDIGQDFVHPPGIGVKTDSACVCVCVSLVISWNVLEPYRSYRCAKNKGTE